MAGKPFGEKMGDWFRNVLSCCNRQDEEEERPALQISVPTNFRREDISFVGVDATTQQWIRDKAKADAGRMYDHLQPLRCSPSGQFADPSSPTKLPTREELTTPRSAPTPGNPPSARRTSIGSHALDRVRAHTRKISSNLTKPHGYQAVQLKDGFAARDGSPYEMRALMDPSRTQVVGPGKLSGESFSVAGSEEERDGGKKF